MLEIIAIAVTHTPFDKLLSDLKQSMSLYESDKSESNKSTLELHLYMAFQKVIIEKSGGLDSFLDMLKHQKHASDLMKHFNNKQ